MAKIWQKNYDLDTMMEAFTVGNDYILDKRLVAADCVGSMAHGKMLAKIGILETAEFDAIRQQLTLILKDQREGRFEILREDEDVHTAIENRLIKRLGETGKKIHTGRSRNDQVIMALRIYMRAFLFEVLDEGLAFCRTMLEFANRNLMVPMPGRTHMQTAMPSTIGLWTGAWIEEMLDNLRVLWSHYDILDASPLGSAASYGVPLPLDREYTAELAGFHRVQNNVLYVNNSRGKMAAFLLDALDHTGITLSRMAQDLILFSLPEFGYFHLPDDLCTGSSIMPQKKNPDVFELMRARSATLSSCASHVKAVLRSLPSGYNRDLQETKESVFRAFDTARSCLGIMGYTFTRLEVNEDNLRRAFKPDIFATDAALELVLAGHSFREAYREVGTHLEELGQRDTDAAIRKRSAIGTPGNPNLPTKSLDAFSTVVETEKKRVTRSLSQLAGFDVDIVN